MVSGTFWSIIGMFLLAFPVTPPTSPFMQRSASSTPTDHSYIQPPPSLLPQSPFPDDSGYDSVFFTTSTNYHQDSVYDDSAITADYLNEIRVQRYTLQLHGPPCASPTHDECYNHLNINQPNDIRV